MVSRGVARSRSRPFRWDNEVAQASLPAVVPCHEKNGPGGPRHLQRLIAEFLNYVRVEKRLSANTAAAYQRDLRRFAGWLAKRECDITAVSRLQLQEYLGELYRAK